MSRLSTSPSFWLFVFGLSSLFAGGVGCESETSEAECQADGDCVGSRICAEGICRNADTGPTDAPTDGETDVSSDAGSTDVDVEVESDGSDADGSDGGDDVTEDADADDAASRCDAGTPCGDTCVDLSSNVDHCGECGATCEAGPGGEPVCEEGTCGIACRDDDAVACSDDPADGCAVPDGDCGGCGDGEVCAGGNCVRVESVSTFVHGTCLRRADGVVECWGEDEDPETEQTWELESPSETFEQIDVGGSGHGCGIRSDGTIRCWGNDAGMAPPEGAYREVSTGYGQHACSIPDEGGVGDRVECWGSPFVVDNLADDREGNFADVSAGTNHNCAVTADNESECWGTIFNFAPEGDVFEEIDTSSGYEHVCALLTSREIGCWDDDSPDNDGHLDTPDGPYEKVSAGGFHTCGLRANGDVDCWGADDPERDKGQAASRSGSYIDVAAGYYHTCAVAESGAVECWGDNSHGQLDVPAGYGRSCP